MKYIDNTWQVIADSGYPSSHRHLLSSKLMRSSTTSVSPALFFLVVCRTIWPSMVRDTIVCWLPLPSTLVRVSSTFCFGWQILLTWITLIIQIIWTWIAPIIQILSIWITLITQIQIHYNKSSSSLYVDLRESSAQKNTQHAVTKTLIVCQLKLSATKNVVHHSKYLWPHSNP